MGLPEIQAASKEEAPKAVRPCGKRSWDPISGQQKTTKNTWLWQCLARMFFFSGNDTSGLWWFWICRNSLWKVPPSAPSCIFGLLVAVNRPHAQKKQIQKEPEKSKHYLQGPRCHSLWVTLWLPVQWSIDTGLSTRDWNHKAHVTTGKKKPPNSHPKKHGLCQIPIGSMYAIYGNMDPINIPQMLA